jgi:hypothetical protein
MIKGSVENLFPTILCYFHDIHGENRTSTISLLPADIGKEYNVQGWIE